MALWQARAEALGNPPQSQPATSHQPQSAQKQTSVAPKQALPAGGGNGTKSGPTNSPIFAIVAADQQGFDGDLGVYLAKGNVRLQFNGWTLLADRVEVAERSRSFFATGQVRLFKGNQYLQASRIRYSYWEGTGEVDDVYGVIDQDTLKSDTALGMGTEPAAVAQTTALANPEAISTPRGSTEQGLKIESKAPAPTFACPQLTASGERSALSLIPPGKTALPTMGAPASCPGESRGVQPRRLLEALERVTFQADQFQSDQLPDGQPSNMAKNLSSIEGQNSSRDINSAETSGALGIAQRVRNVSYQQSFGAGFKVNLGGLVGFTAPANLANGNPAGRGFNARTFDNPKGTISRIRFQSSNLQIQRDAWTARQMAFTNDPFTPARSWTIARNVTATFNPNGTTTIAARTSNIILDNKLSLPSILTTTVGGEQSSYAIGSDKDDRDGIYLGYNLKPIKIGTNGVLNLQPQLLIERAISGQSGSFIAPGASLGSSTVTQSINAADAFGLLGNLKLPLGKFNLNSNLSLATFNPDRLASGTRNTTTLDLPLKLPGNNSATVGLFGTYRERSFNGSLGLQNVIYAYGANLTGSATLASKTSTNPASTNTIFQPIGIQWALQSGNFQADLFSTSSLATLQRTRFNATASSSLSLWKQQPQNASNNPLTGLRYSPTAIQPGLDLNYGLTGVATGYSDGSTQNTLTLFGGPTLTLGNFDKPFFDYTKLSASIGGTFINGLSPFSFDRAVDLRTVSFSVAQQIYGPVVLEAGATYNIDPKSEFFGQSSYSFFEVKLQRRSYELGVFYSPYDGIGGIRVKLNDFNFDGTGAPFIPTASGSFNVQNLPIRRSAS